MDSFLTHVYGVAPRSFSAPIVSVDVPRWLVSLAFLKATKSATGLFRRLVVLSLRKCVMSQLGPDLVTVWTVRGQRPEKRDRVEPEIDDDFEHVTDDDVATQMYMSDSERVVVMHESEKAQGMRRAIVNAFFFKEGDLMTRMVPTLERANFSAEVVQRSGLLWLMKCERVWSNTSHRTRVRT